MSRSPGATSLLRAIAFSRGRVAGAECAKVGWATTSDMGAAVAELIIWACVNSSAGGGAGKALLAPDAERARDRGKDHQRDREIGGCVLDIALGERVGRGQDHCGLPVLSPITLDRP